MTKWQALNHDVTTVRARIAAQEQQDPDHEVALAMFRADLKRAEFAVMEHQAATPKTHWITPPGAPA